MLFLWVSSLHLINKKCGSNFHRNEMKKNIWKEQKHWYVINTWSDNAFKNTNVNHALMPSAYIPLKAMPDQEGWFF